MEFKYITTTKNRHGTVVEYLRLPAHLNLPASGQKLRMPGRRGSPEFLAFYRAQLAGKPTPAAPTISRHAASAGIKEGTVRALVVGYLASDAFKSLGAANAKHRRRYLENICASPDPDDTSLTRATIKASELRQSDCVKVQHDKLWADNGTSTGDAHLVAFKAMLSWAVRNDLLNGNPALNIAPMRSDDDTHEAWTDADIAAFKKRHPVGTMARLAFDIVWTTGMRRSDVFRFGPQHVNADAGEIVWTERKGSRSFAITSKKPLRAKKRQLDLTAELAASIVATRAALIIKGTRAGQPYGRQLVYLLDEFGKPFNCGTYGKQMLEWIRQAGLRKHDHDGKVRHISTHGLRHAAANKLAEEGKSELQIATFLGHSGLQHVRRYTMHASRVRLQREAVATLGSKPNAKLLREVA